MSFTDQINSLSKSCHIHIRDIRRIRYLLPPSGYYTKLANSLISSNIAINSTMAFRKLTWTKYSAYNIRWLVSLQIHQYLNTSHQYSKNYIGFQSNNASTIQTVSSYIPNTPNSVTYISLQYSLLSISLSVYKIIWFIRWSCSPSHMFEHNWVRGIGVTSNFGFPQDLKNGLSIPIFALVI